MLVNFFLIFGHYIFGYLSGNGIIINKKDLTFQANYSICLTRKWLIYYITG